MITQLDHFQVGANLKQEPTAAEMISDDEDVNYQQPDRDSGSDKTFDYDANGDYREDSWMVDAFWKDISTIVKENIGGARSLIGSLPADVVATVPLTTHSEKENYVTNPTSENRTDRGIRTGVESEEGFGSDIRQNASDGLRGSNRVDEANLGNECK